MITKKETTKIAGRFTTGRMNGAIHPVFAGSVMLVISILGFSLISLHADQTRAEVCWSELIASMADRCIDSARGNLYFRAYPTRPDSSSAYDRRFPRGRAALVAPGCLGSDYGVSLRSALVLVGSRKHERVVGHERVLPNSVANGFV